MEEEEIGFYWYGMDLHLKITNMIVFHSEYALYKLVKRLVN